MPMLMKMTPGQIIAEHQKTLPVDILSIAWNMGLNVWEMNDMPEGISGKIFKDELNGGESGYSIGVNASEGSRRKRFTIAHEIAHFILHKDKIGDELTDDAMYRSGLSNKEEARANQLAADILMPAIPIRRLLSQGHKDVRELADKFEVSEAAMKVRLSYL